MSATIHLEITPAEIQRRVEKLLDYVQREKLSGVVLFDNYRVLYYTGFAFIPTERPIAFALSAKGEQGVLVPRLEVEHVRAETCIERVAHYFEYPNEPHPTQFLRTMLREMGVEKVVGADHDGYPWIFGYQGPTLSELMGCKVVNATAFVEGAMAIKSEAELQLIRESAKWAGQAHKLLQQNTRVGVTETDASVRTGAEAMLEMMKAIGQRYRSHSIWSSGPFANYRGQIGRNAAIPHILATNAVFMEGDMLVSGAGCPMWGYNSELERTMILGKPSDAQRRFFDYMKRAQEIAFDAMKPGIRCNDVDQAVKTFYEDNHLMPYWKHHTGHAIGLRYHEAPFLDTGDDTPLAQGMVFTIEPGLYNPELGGFRHSDTVAITKDGIEMITNYPRALESLTIPA